jgi:hypothetical protein
MRKGFFGIVVVSLFAAGTAFADGAAPSAPASGPKYGAAGCGLGSILIGNKPGFMQVFAATTNGTSNSQTFGITSGTSNCADTGGGTASTKSFVVANRDALIKDIARGSGETVASVATLGGCSDVNAVGVSLQRNFQSIYPEASVSSDGMAEAVVGALKSDASLQCSKL